MWELRTGFSQTAGTVASYDPAIDAVIFPTAYVPSDVVRTVFHEFGHALTIRTAVIRAGLLHNLPPGIAVHVAQRAYDTGDPIGTLTMQVHEALAEAYVYLLTGRAEQLPSPLLSELTMILATVTEGANLRLDFDLAG